MKNLPSIFLMFLTYSLFAQAQIDSTNILTFYFSGNKYEIIKEGYSWVNAAKIADERGGILAEINSQTEQDTIFYYLNQAEIDITKTVAADGGNASYIWIGGNDLNEEGNWLWDGNYDGVGKQFWEGTTTGNIVGDLYNNWGNEPDNFGNQDALGLAITNWPRGSAGQWNDVRNYNSLYSVIEYDNSTFKAGSAEYLYQNNLLLFNLVFEFPVDSIQIIVDNYVHETFKNINSGNSELESYYSSDSTKIINLHLIAYTDSHISYSNPFKFETYSFSNPINSYSTDFEATPTNDFMSENFIIVLSAGFRNMAIHSPHNYENNVDYNITLTKPIIVDPTNSIISYSDVAIIEPGENGSVFGQDEFNDYVIVEGLKNQGTWKELNTGYDANQFPDWLTAWSATTLYRKLYKKQEIDLTSTFSVGDTVLIRFRLHADDSTNGWGWVIDSLQVQDIQLGNNDKEIELLEFNLKQNYPNPFNPSTIIEYNIPQNTKNNSMQYTTLKVFDVLGREVATMVNSYQAPGNYKITFNAEHLSSGIYYYSLSYDGFVSSKKMLLLR